MRERGEEGGEHGRREEVREGERTLRDGADVTRSHPMGTLCQVSVL